MEPQDFFNRKVWIKDSGSLKVYDCTGMSEAGYAVLMRDGVFHSKTVPFDRLEPVPKPETEVGKGYASTSGFRTTPDEATEWFAFLMLQAADLFCNVPPDSREELERILTVRGETAAGPCVTAALAYYDAAIKWYADDDEEKFGWWFP